MRTIYYLDLSEQIDSYGEITERNFKRLNDRLEDAAEQAGVKIVWDGNLGAYLGNPEPEDYAEPLDWFKAYCEGGWRWTTAQWVSWIEKQLA